jgi:hypothetical protein
MCVEHQPEGQGKDANRADQVSYKSHVIILVLPPPRVHRPDFARQGIAPSGGYGLGSGQLRSYSGGDLIAHPLLGICLQFLDCVRRLAVNFAGDQL